MKDRNLVGSNVGAARADRPIARLIHRYRVVQSQVAQELGRQSREGYGALCALAQELADLRSRIRRTLAERHRSKRAPSNPSVANASLLLG